MQNIATRDDILQLRKDMIGRETFDAQLSLIRSLIDLNREITTRMQVEIDELKEEQVTRQDRLWLRFGQVAGLAALALSVFELLTHVKIGP